VAELDTFAYLTVNVACSFCIYFKIHARSVDEGDGGRLSLPLCDPGSIRFLLLRLAPGRLRDQNQGCHSCDIGIQGLLSPVIYIFRNLRQNFKQAVVNLTTNKPGEIPTDVASICNVFFVTVTVRFNVWQKFPVVN